MPGGWTALRAAAAGGDTQVITALIAAGGVPVATIPLEAFACAGI
jgi:hypothetical protein